MTSPPTRPPRLIHKFSSSSALQPLTKVFLSDWYPQLSRKNPLKSYIKRHVTTHFSFLSVSQHTALSGSGNYKAEKNVLMSRHTFFTLFFLEICFFVNFQFIFILSRSDCLAWIHYQLRGWFVSCVRHAGRPRNVFANRKEDNFKLSFQAVCFLRDLNCESGKLYRILDVDHFWMTKF